MRKDHSLATTTTRAESPHTLPVVTRAVALFALGVAISGCKDSMTEPKVPESELAARDRAALEALYNATEGEDWARRDNWLTDAPLGE